MTFGGQPSEPARRDPTPQAFEGGAVLSASASNRDLAGRYETDSSDYRWTAIPALAVGLLVTVTAWHTVSAKEKSQVRWTTKLAAQAIQVNLVTDLAWQSVGLERLAMLWEAARPGEELWAKNAELYIQHRPGCVAVEWLTPSRERQVLVTAGRNVDTKALAFAGLPEALLDATGKAGVAMIGPPETLPDGSSQWVIAYPVYAKHQPQGSVVAFFDLERALKHILGDVKDLGFSVGLSQPGQPEYVLPGTSRQHEQEWGTVVTVPLSGTTWVLRVWPNADVVSQIESELPGVTLAVGCVVSLLIALLVYFASVTALSYAGASRANEALQGEVSRREGAEAELRQAHAELEVRIEERTAELATANALLHKEVTEHERAEGMLRQLTGRLFELQDQERRRLGRELHDGAVQSLVASAIDLGMIRDAVPAEDAGARRLVNECAGLIERSTSDLRTLSYLLHPPYFEELGLTASLRDFVDGFAARSGIQVSLDIDRNFGRLGYELEMAIYRVIQESLSNVLRHSGSRTARIALERYAEFVQVEIADAGRGIPPEILAPDGTRFAGVGIAGMRERMRGLGGRLEIRSGPGGTTIQAVLPVPSLSTA